MSTKHLIAANDFCVYHQVEYTFITSLQEAGLVDIKVINKTTYIPETELQKLEKMIRLHNELDINVAGIEAITHLLDRLEQLQKEIQLMRNKLLFHNE